MIAVQWLGFERCEGFPSSAIEPPGGSPLRDCFGRKRTFIGLNRTRRNGVSKDVFFNHTEFGVVDLQMEIADGDRFVRL